MPDNRDLDELLDRALASYTAAEPDVSLRARIMAQAEAVEQPRWPVWIYAAAAACAAALALAFLLHPIARGPRPEPSPEIFTAGASPSPAQLKTVSPLAIHPRVFTVAQRTRQSDGQSPTLRASFPSPTPLTAQENLLLQFATEHPEQARQVLAAPSSRPIANPPLAIASIHITPLSETP